MKILQHPANVDVFHDQGLGQRIGNAVVNGMGTMTFVTIQTGIILVWIALNVLAVAGHWDPYPFILLNLAFSTQAAYASPFILLSQKQQSKHDRLALEHDFENTVQALTHARESRQELAEVKQELVELRKLLTKPARPRRASA